MARKGCPDLDPNWPDSGGHPRGPTLCTSYPDCACGEYDRAHDNIRHVGFVEPHAESFRRGGSTRTAKCSCGWIGPQRGTLELAVDDALIHEKSDFEVARKVASEHQRDPDPVNDDDDDRIDRESVPYDEARNRMAQMLGNFSYGLNDNTLAAFLEELLNYFEVTREQFVATAGAAWDHDAKEGDGC